MTSDVSEARARMKPRLQRLVFEIGRIPGALPQAVDDGAPLALNRHQTLFGDGGVLAVTQPQEGEAGLSNSVSSSRQPKQISAAKSASGTDSLGRA